MSNFKREYLTRQEDLIPWEDLNAKITIVGAGAIGSWVSLSLAKMGFINQHVLDFDVISTENMNCQFFGPQDIGRPKTTALYDLVYRMTGVKVRVTNKEVQPTDKIETDILITAVDSMQVRKMLDEISVRRFTIDPRMAAEYASMEVVDHSRMAHVMNYKKTLYSDDEAKHERCTAKATMYTVNLIAGQVCKAVKDIATKQPYVKTFDWNIAKNSLISFNPEGTVL